TRPPTSTLFPFTTLFRSYVAWEKSYTSNFGAINEFDNENYLQFLAGGNDSEFRSSQDPKGRSVNNLYWDYTGLYGVGNINGNARSEEHTSELQSRENLVC